jgi:hypothetical protein
MFPVIAMCGHRCGLHITATTAICAPVITVCPANMDDWDARRSRSG